MAIATGITPDKWTEMGEQAIVTAWQILTTPAPTQTASSSGTEAPEGWEYRSA